MISRGQIRETMRPDFPRAFEPGAGPRKNPEWISVALLVVCVPWGMWSIYALLAGGDSVLVAFYSAAGWFFILGCGYLGLHGVRGIAWCSVPALLTIRALLEFGIIPCWRFANGDDQIDGIYVHAMLLTLMGFGAFWIASLFLKRKGDLQFVPVASYTPSRVAVMSALMLLLGFVGNFTVWKLGISTFLWTISDAGAQQSNLPFMSEVTFVANLLNVALVVSAIEVLGKHSKDPLIRFVFGASVVFSIVFGALSGMKSEILYPILYLLVVYTMTNRRLPRIAVIMPLLLIIIYPFVDAYRRNLDIGYAQVATTLSGQADVLTKTFEDVVESPFSGREQSGKSFALATDRLSLLSYMHDVIGLPAPSLLNGDEKVWMAPFYPLIPRFLWKNKPILDKGSRLSVALGKPPTTATAITQIGDLYSLYKTPGVIIGMALWGIMMQLYMNWAGKGRFSEKRLFIYISFLIALINVEQDVTAFTAGLVLLGIRVFAVSRIIYGPAGSSVPRLAPRTAISTT
jgi:hypothetical protein